MRFPRRGSAFLGWDGRAGVLWSERGLALEIVADPPLSIYILYSPGGDSDFFCFEPVSHLIDAHNLPGGAGGLINLAPQETLSAACQFRPYFGTKSKPGGTSSKSGGTKSKLKPLLSFAELSLFNDLRRPPRYFFC